MSTDRQDPPGDDAPGPDAAAEPTGDRTDTGPGSPAPPRGPDDVRYLSLAWIHAVAAEIAASEPLRELAEQHEIGVTQVVSDGPEGDVVYHLVVADGSAEFGPGPAEPEDVRMEQEWQTAVAVATGELNAGDAFANGHIRLYGNQQKLLDANSVFGPLDRAFRRVGERTRYE